ncbi:glycine betaine ABC transporter substrate-binding protein [Methanohalophilus sp.]
MKTKILFALIICFSLAISGCSQAPQEDTKGEVVIGSKLFQESYIMAHMLGIILDDAGYDVEVREGLGGTFVNYEALKKGEINTYVEYTGTAYSQILKKPSLDTWESQTIYNETATGFAQENITIATSLGFENAYALAVKESWAEENGVTTISDLGPYASEMVIGTDPEFAKREDGLPHIKDVYDIEFKEYKQTVSNIMYESIKNDEVDAVSAYTTDTRNEVFNLRVLKDNQNALPPYDAIVIVTDEFAANNPDAIEAIQQLNNRIDTDTMRQLNYKFDVEKMDAETIAHDFLVQEGLITE